MSEDIKEKCLYVSPYFYPIW